MKIPTLCVLLAEQELELRLFYPYVEFRGDNNGDSIIQVIAVLALSFGAFFLGRLVSGKGEHDE